MQLTFVGLIQLVLGVAIVLGGSLRTAFAFLMVSGLFGGSAALLLPALGGASILPVQFAILFVYIRMLVPGSGYLRTLGKAVDANLLLVLFTAYGIAAAILGPRLFGGSLEVVPMRYIPSDDLFDTVPLVFTSQNITAIGHLLGTMLVACAAYQVCYHRGGVNTLISTGVVISWLHAGLGIVVALARGTPLDAFFELFRNGSYAQVNQEFGNFVRMQGLFPEPSSFAAFGFAYFVLNAELWYRGIRPAATGAAALGLGLVLFASTSSTAYVGLGGYFAFFILRLLLLPAMADPVKLRQIAVGTLAMMVIVSILLLIVPRLGLEIYEMVSDMTIGKSNSASGQQRMFWAMQGWEAFKSSYGLGIGPGSFRSSSLITGMMGATGIIGIGLFGVYLYSVYQPTRASTMGRTGDLAFTVGGALATAALLTLLPLAVSSPGADPKTTFALLAGAALALRPARHSMRHLPSVSEPGHEPPVAQLYRDVREDEEEDVFLRPLQ